jgi:NAD(P)-dependent dehydrogenase (short-subunit alcohol dehydrogenase family)
MVDEQRTIVITGATDGLGKGLASELAPAGGRLVLHGRNEEKGQALLEELRPRATGELEWRRADLSSLGEVRDLADSLLEEDRIDVLVNNAGIGTAVPATRETPEQFRNVIDVNLNGQYWMAQAFGRAATEGGSIVNISSVLGLRPGSIPQAAYAASKAGLLGLTRDLAAQWTGRKGIRVNAICPGYFPSEMTDDLDPREGELVKLITPAGRYGEPYEVGDACVFLGSEASSYITGVSLCVDGGMVMP